MTWWQWILVTWSAVLAVGMTILIVIAGAAHFRNPDNGKREGRKTPRVIK